MKIFSLGLLAFLASLSLPSSARAQELYQYQPITPRWISPENRTGTPGGGGVENGGAKGHPYETLKAGGTLVLADVQGAGIIRRIWITVNERSPEMLRSLRLEMFWDRRWATSSARASARSFPSRMRSSRARRAARSTHRFRCRSVDRRGSC